MDFGGGVVDFKRTLNEFPCSALVIGLYLSDASACTNQPLRAIMGRARAEAITGQPNTYLTSDLVGRYAYYLDQFANYLQSLGDREVYLRIGYEYDGLWNCYSPELFKEAFRVITKAVKAKAKNAQTV